MKNVMKLFLVIAVLVLVQQRLLKSDQAFLISGRCLE